MGFNAFLERLIAGRWIAGANESDAITAALRFKRANINSIINYLGEEFTQMEEINSTVKKYIDLEAEIGKRRLGSDLSVKLTQLGMLVSRKACHRNLDLIVKRAKTAGIFVWIDMEEENIVDRTIEEYLTEASHGNVGICIQAYTLNSGEKLRRVVRAGGIVRLVKGAYPLSEDTFRTRREITRNYGRLMLYLFRNSKRFTIATHDIALVEKAIRYNIKYKKDVTYAMLNGVRNRYLKALAEKGYKTAVYLPFGEKWIDYSYRRLKEAGHATIILKSLFERQGV